MIVGVSFPLGCIVTYFELYPVYEVTATRANVKMARTIRVPMGYSFSGFEAMIMPHTL